jgi:hypothetical protein
MVAVPGLNVKKLPATLHTRSSIGNGTSISELERACRNMPNFRGVFFQDFQFPRHGCYIFNLDNHKGPGTHWVAVYFNILRSIRSATSR